MKKLIIGLLAVCGLYACSKTPEQQAKALIVQELKENLHNYASYESVKFGTLDSTFTTYDDSKEIIEAVTKFDSLVKVRNKKIEEYVEANKFREISYYREQSEKASKESEILTDSVHKYKVMADSLMKSFTPRFNGWSITHSFRADNSSGHKIISHYKYYFDEGITTITRHEDMSESAE